MSKFIGGLLTIGLLGVMVALFLGSANVRFSLITVQPAFWLLSIGIVFLIGGGWLASADTPGGAFFAGLGVILLFIGGYRAIWPNTSTASANAQVTVDKQGATAINLIAGPKFIPCDKTTEPRPIFFDPVTSDALIWVALDKATGRFECYNKPGFHTLTRQPLIAVETEAFAMTIMAQEPLAKPSPPVTEVAIVPPPLPTPVWSPTPLRELGEGYIINIPESEGGGIRYIMKEKATPSPTPQQ